MVSNNGTGALQDCWDRHGLVFTNTGHSHFHYLVVSPWTKTRTSWHYHLGSVRSHGSFAPLLPWVYHRLALCPGTSCQHNRLRIAKVCRLIRRAYCKRLTSPTNPLNDVYSASYVELSSICTADNSEDSVRSVNDTCEGQNVFPSEERQDRCGRCMLAAT